MAEKKKAKAAAAEECAATIAITVPAKEIVRVFDEVFDEITKVANIPGFRVGKAPKEMVKKHYAKDAREEALKRLIPDAYRAAVEERKLDPIGLPAISNVDFDGATKLSFTAQVDTRPSFTLKTYKGIKLEKKKAAITDDEIAKTLESLREMHAKYTAVEDRPVAMGDYVVSDLDASFEGKPLHKRRENLWLFMDKESFIPGIPEKMVGMQKGEERDIEVTLPDKYPDKKVAGKKVQYHVKAKEIKTRQLPVVDDEFAKDLGRADLADLKNEVRRELEARLATNIQADVENQVLAKLVDDHHFAVPPSFVARQLDYMVENAKEKLLKKGLAKQDLDGKDGEFREKFRDDAVKRVRLLFILDAIAQAEKIATEDADLEKAYAEIAAQVGRTSAAVKEHYEKEEIVDDLSDKIREEKVVAFLLANAQITEKSI